MTYLATDQLVTLRQRFFTGEQLTQDDVGVLFQVIDVLEQGCTSAALVQLSQEDFEALTVVYNALMVALRRAGLDLQRVTATDGVNLPWVWFYHWSGCSRQGPFGTLDAAVGSAMLQVRSGVLQKKS